MSEPALLTIHTDGASRGNPGEAAYAYTIVRDRAPDIEEAAMWPVTLATATAGEMPRKISSGVMRNPPPIPNMPEMNPTASPIARMTNTLTGRSAIGR